MADMKGYGVIPSSLFQLRLELQFSPAVLSKKHDSPSSGFLLRLAGGFLVTSYTDLPVFQSEAWNSLHVGFGLLCGLFNNINSNCTYLYILLRYVTNIVHRLKGKHSRTYQLIKTFILNIICFVILTQKWFSRT